MSLILIESPCVVHQYTLTDFLDLFDLKHLKSLVRFISLYLAIKVS